MSKRDAQRIFDADESRNNVTYHVRQLAAQAVDFARQRGGGGQTSPEQLTANGALSSLKINAKLTSSGNTLTLTPIGNGAAPVYGEDGQGWVPLWLIDPVTLDVTGSTSNRLYDVFIYPNPIVDPPTAALEVVAWTDETTRAVSLITQDGESLKSTDTSRHLLATVRYNGSTMLVPTNNPNGEDFYGTGDPRNNVSDPATGVGIYAGGVSLGGVVYNLFTALNGVVGWGVDLLGNIRAIAGGFKLNSTEMSLTVSSNMVMQITAAYALFGSNVAAANTTAFAIFFTAQTYNTESMEAGSVLFGSNSANYANALWRPSTKQLQFRSGTTVQAYIDTTGAITAAAGDIVLDVLGIRVLTSSTIADKRAYSFTNAAGSTVYGGFYGSNGAGFNSQSIKSNLVAGLKSAINLIATSPAASNATIVFTAEENGVKQVNIYMQVITGGQSLLRLNPGGYDTDISLESASDAAALFVEGSSGNVGVGTGTPAYDLDVTGKARVTAQFDEAQGANIASATTTDIGAATGNYVKVTGTTTITGFGTIQAGTRRIVEFTGILTLTYNATSMILPGAVNITTATGDIGTFVSLGSGNWKCVDYSRIASPPQSGTNTGDQTLRHMIGGSGANGTVGAGATAYLGAFYTGAPAATELDVSQNLLYNGTMRNLRLRTRTAQPGTGTLVITNRVAASDTAITFTIAAGAASGAFSDLSNTASIATGNLHAVKAVNNASGASAQIAMWAAEIDAS